MLVNSTSCDKPFRSTDGKSRFAKRLTPYEQNAEKKRGDYFKD
jgi:hypothetical protein